MIYATVVPIIPPSFEHAIVPVVNNEIHFPTASNEDHDIDPEVLAKQAIKNCVIWPGNQDRLVYFGEQVLSEKSVHRFAYICFPHERMPDSTADIQFYRRPMEKLLAGEYGQLLPEYYDVLQLAESYMHKIRQRFEKFVEASATTKIKKVVVGEAMGLFLSLQDNWTQMRGVKAKNGLRQIGRWGRNIVFVSSKMPPSSLSVTDMDGNTGVYQ